MNCIVAPWFSSFVHVLYLQFIAKIPFRLTNMRSKHFSVSVVHNFHFHAKLDFRVLEVLRCERGRLSLSEHSQSPSGDEAHWSSWLRNNASQSVNNYASPVKDRLQSCCPCLSESILWCTEASLHSTVCKHGGGGWEVGKAALFNQPESHISRPSADEAEQADSPEAWQLPTAEYAASLITTWWY